MAVIANTTEVSAINAANKPKSASVINGELASKAGLKSFSDNLNNFLVLLTTQLKNQDPTSPVDSAKFTDQLAQMSAVEQQVSINKNLESLISLQEQSRKVSALSYIGATIEGESGELYNAGKGGAFSYELQGKAANLTLTITDSKGNAVHKKIIETPAEGRQKFTWDGKDDAGKDTPSGTYNIIATAIDDTGKSVQTKLYSDGLVEGVDSSLGAISLIVGGARIPLDNVNKVKFQAQASGHTTTN